MAEVFEDSYSAEALANMENYIISFGTLIKDVGSGEAFKNALFGMKVMIESKPRRVADLSKIYPGSNKWLLRIPLFYSNFILTGKLRFQMVFGFNIIVASREEKR